MDAASLESFKRAMLERSRKEFLVNFGSDPREPFGVFWAHANQTYATALVFHAALEATGRLLGLEKAIEAILKREDESLEHIEEVKAAARVQQASGFPAVYGQAVIVAWSTVETFLRDTVKAWLSGPAVCWIDSKLISDASNLVEYERRRLSGTVAEMLFELAERTARAEAPRGAPTDKWNWLLGRLDLAPRNLDREIEDRMRELSLVRNLLAHSPTGKVDQRFFDAWPERWTKRWPDLTIDSTLRVDLIDSLSYLTATLSFGNAVNQRLYARLDELAASWRPPAPSNKLEGLGLGALLGKEKATADPDGGQSA